MDIGIITRLHADGKSFDIVRQFGLRTCQLASMAPTLATEANAEAVVRESERSGVRVCAMWGGFPGQGEWNFRKGPVTLGFVPEGLRAERVEAMKRWADFAVWIGAPAVITHCGFIPENATDAQYGPVVDAIREVAEYCGEKGIEFWFETGQETPVVLLRTIERVGTGNLGINLDPANLILYGKGNPVDALDVIGPYVRNVHVKDGFYPTNGDELGEQVAVGKGKVDFPKLFAGLEAQGFRGEWIIEREGRVGEEEKNRDIVETIHYLQKHVAGARV
ncbi:sugar phosphate isomerase/epimerase family protein [Paenibacillus hodogayensis]|uniref:Sugar phosphate isomerase/epimerase family protein n=1 Tax=Paenibacillus hodogayensis TaxID=279208 RepID=A0ABV5VUA4_9BACL